MSRVTIAGLTVRDTASGKAVLLSPGVVLDECRTIRLDDNRGSYGMEFRIGGVLYRCPLFDFQARTEVLEPAGDDSAVRRAIRTSTRRQVP